MEWLMHLAALEGDRREWDTGWWRQWFEQLRVYFALPQCTHCSRSIDFQRVGSHGRCGPCWM